MKIFNLLLYILILSCTFQSSNAQKLQLKQRSKDALGGKQFALSISDSTLSLEKREEIIFKEVKQGNVPDFLRHFKKVKDTIVRNEQTYSISCWVLPDYFAIGNNDDYFYLSMTPNLAQRIAKLIHCSLPTKKMVDEIYQSASIKLRPQPILPTKAMTTLPVFIAHTDSVIMQLKAFESSHRNGKLTAGNKKDIIISNKIYTEKSPKVVIYGWHNTDGKPIQPVYNKHTNLWADYSHGSRYILLKMYVNNKKMRLTKILIHPELSFLLSDEGTIAKPFYPENY